MEIPGDGKSVTPLCRVTGPGIAEKWAVHETFIATLTTKYNLESGLNSHFGISTGISETLGGQPDLAWRGLCPS